MWRFCGCDPRASESRVIALVPQLEYNSTGSTARAAPRPVVSPPDLPRHLLPKPDSEGLPYSRRDTAASLLARSQPSVACYRNDPGHLPYATLPSRLRPDLFAPRRRTPSALAETSCEAVTISVNAYSLEIRAAAVKRVSLIFDVALVRDLGRRVLTSVREGERADYRQKERVSLRIVA